MADFRINKKNKDEITIIISRNENNDGGSVFVKIVTPDNSDHSACNKRLDKPEVNNLPAVINPAKSHIRRGTKTRENNSAFIAQYAAQTNHLRSQNHIGNLMPSKANYKYSNRQAIAISQRVRSSNAGSMICAKWL